MQPYEGGSFTEWVAIRLNNSFEESGIAFDQLRKVLISQDVRDRLRTGGFPPRFYGVPVAVNPDLRGFAIQFITADVDYLFLGLPIPMLQDELEREERAELRRQALLVSSRMPIKKIQGLAWRRYKGKIERKMFTPMHKRKLNPYPDLLNMYPDNFTPICVVI